MRSSSLSRLGVDGIEAFYEQCVAMGVANNQGSLSWTSYGLGLVEGLSVPGPR